jgi:hypothetical protein
MSTTRAQTIVAVGLMMKPVGKPDAGNPHVRFDERGGETGSPNENRASPRLYKSRDASAISSPIHRAIWLAWWCIPPISRTVMAAPSRSHQSVGFTHGCDTSSPMAAMLARSCAARSRRWADGTSKSSSDPIEPKASWFCRAGGWSSVHSRGSEDAVGSPRISNAPSPAQQHGG